MAQYPQDFDVQAERRRAAAGRDYTTPAVITLLLYWLFYIPGLIANIVYWLQASKDEQLAGHAPQGKGCLLALLIVYVAVPLVVSVLAVCATIAIVIAA